MGQEKKQKRLETQRNEEAEEELKRIEESKEAMKRYRGRQWNPSELNPVDASERLFKDGRTADLRRREMQRKKLEDELQKIEDERIRARPARFTPDATPLATCKEASQRLHEDAQRRQETQKERDDRKERIEPVKSTGNINRHRELYEEAKT